MKLLLSTGRMTILAQLDRTTAAARDGNQALSSFALYRHQHDTIYQSLLDHYPLLLAAVLGYALIMHISLDQNLPFARVLLIALVPMALPATFTLTTSWALKS